jgi:hypothetical protein
VVVVSRVAAASGRSDAGSPASLQNQPAANTPKQRGIREFLKVRTSYDVLPLSFRLVVLDNNLLIKKSLNILIQNGAVPSLFL